MGDSEHQRTFAITAYLLATASPEQIGKTGTSFTSSALAPGEGSALHRKNALWQSLLLG